MIHRNSVPVRKTIPFPKTKDTLLNTINVDNSHIALMLSVDCSVFYNVLHFDVHMVHIWTILIGGFVVLLQKVMEMKIIYYGNLVSIRSELFA